ncbi:MAG: hypothetical protein MZU97_02020 [Bacillus subtilis]|nr:hypothetical protein [Bacillus subtilis]
MESPQELEDEGFSENDISKLVDLALNTPSLSMLIGLAPMETTPKTIETIYRESLTAYSKIKL